ncbi:zinc finger protein 436-like [Macrobrachium nipponense]|uniref:zinc finger protein 436-like n=1 Tax=Macrobrachium nipponense TaxID=159736 RepID=UPI0030C86C2B
MEEANINAKKRKVKEEPKTYNASKKPRVEKATEKQTPEKKKSESKPIITANNAEKNGISPHPKRPKRQVKTAKEDTDDSALPDKDAKDPAEDHIAYLEEFELDKNKPKPKDLKCTICGKCSSAKSDLIKTNISESIRGIGPYKCKICNASFIQVTAFHGHITIHTGEKPFKCDLCRKSFAIKDRLRLHMRIHTGEKPHKCSQCNLTFARRSQVTQHQRVHTGKKDYQCTECNARFASYHTLKGHVMAHRGVKEFQCGACGNKKFIQCGRNLPHLKKHMKCVHNATKPYLCKLCKEYFQTQSELEAHNRDVHGIAKTAEEEAEEIVEEASLARPQKSTGRAALRISSEERRCKFGFGSLLVDEVLKLSLQSSGHEPFEDPSLSRLDELRKNVLLLLQWTIPKDTMEEIYKNNMTVDEVLDMLTT